MAGNEIAVDANTRIGENRSASSFGGIVLNFNV
jgi:hypothetical protein